MAASVGAAIDRGDPDSAEELVDRADRAMYSVKLSRRPPIEAATEEDLEAAAARVTGGRRAEDGDFVYPPQRPAAPEAVVARAGSISSGVGGCATGRQRIGGASDAGSCEQGHLSPVLR